jgi:hypothetical protein
MDDVVANMAFHQRCRHLNTSQQGEHRSSFRVTISNVCVSNNRSILPKMAVHVVCRKHGRTLTDVTVASLDVNASTRTWVHDVNVSSDSYGDKYRASWKHTDADVTVTTQP